MAFITKGSITVATDTVDYIMRPSSVPFDDMSLWEFLEQTEKVRRTSTECKNEQSDDESWDATMIVQRRAYTCRLRRAFADQSHPQYNMHELCLRNKRVVPVLLGESIPLPRKSDWRMEEFCRVMLLLFRPWRSVSSLLSGFSCWTEAFDAYHFKEHVLPLIDNFAVELECKDSRDFHRSQYLTGKQKVGSGPVSLSVSTSPNDIELLHNALEEDSDLDDAHYLDDNIDAEVDDCELSISEMLEDEKQIVTMTRALWDNRTHLEVIASDSSVVFQVTSQHCQTIKEHGIYMALQRKRKHHHISLNLLSMICLNGQVSVCAQRQQCRASDFTRVYGTHL